MSDLSTELEILRRRLRLALVCAPVVLTTAPGCTSGESNSAPSKRGNLFGNNDQRPPEPPPPPEPEEFFYPTCPSGEWCGTKALAEPLRGTDEYARAIPDFEGCPGRIGGLDINVDDRAAYGELDIHTGMFADVDAKATQARRSAGEEDACCYRWMTMCPGGRPLLDAGRPQLARLREGERWTAALPELDRRAIARLPAELRSRIAAAWLADARMEHSSIASFARARRELAAVDAPPSLLRGCKRAAIDERRHARICFGIAAAYGGVAYEPTVLARASIRAGSLEQIATDTFIEGCVGETVAAACVRRAASEALDPALARLLHAIADDEAEHAALAWQTLAWAIDRGGASVHAAVKAVADRLRPRADDQPSEAEPPMPTGHGRLDPLARAQVRRAAWTTIIDPLLG